MNFYTRITVWENRRRLEKLGKFRDLVLTYFNNSRAEWMADARIEQPAAEAARVQINRVMSEVHDIVLHSGIRPSIRWTPPPAVGGYVQDVDLINNIFHLHRFQIAPANVLDFIDRAIGVYESNDRRALLRTFNPIFYLGLVFDWIASLPFVLIGRLGFSRGKAESSILGRMTKAFLYLVTAAASILTVLELLGYLEVVKEWARS